MDPAASVGAAASAPLSSKAPPPIMKARLPTAGSTVAGSVPPQQPAGVVAFGAPRVEDYWSNEVLHEINGHHFTQGDPNHSRSARAAGPALCKPGVVASCNGPLHLWQIAELKDDWFTVHAALKAEGPGPGSTVGPPRRVVCHESTTQADSGGRNAVTEGGQRAGVGHQYWPSTAHVGPRLAQRCT